MRRKMSIVLRMDIENALYHLMIHSPGEAQIILEHILGYKLDQNGNELVEATDEQEL